MRIPLDSFEQYIPELALRRGLKLVDEDKVMHLAHLGNGRYTAEVKEGDVYQPEMDISAGNIIKTRCTCAEFDGQWCRHSAALVLAQQAGVLGIAEEPKPLKKGRKPKSTAETSVRPVPKAKPKKLSPKEELDFVLHQLSEEELRDFVLLLAEGNNLIKAQLLLRFGHYLPGQSVDKLKEQVKAGINEIIGRRQYIEPAEERKLDRLFADYEQLLTWLLNEQKPERVMPLFAAIIALKISRIDALLTYYQPPAKTMESLYQLALKAAGQQPLLAADMHQAVAKELVNSLPLTLRAGGGDIFPELHYRLWQSWQEGTDAGQALQAIDQALEAANIDRYNLAPTELSLYQLFQPTWPALADAFALARHNNPLMAAQQVQHLLDKKDYAAALSAAGTALDHAAFDLPRQQVQALQKQFIEAAMGTGHYDEALAAIRNHFRYADAELPGFYLLARALDIPAKEQQRMKKLAKELLLSSYQEARLGAMLRLLIADNDEEGMTQWAKHHNLLPYLLTYRTEMEEWDRPVFRTVTQAAVLGFIEKRRRDVDALLQLITGMLRQDGEATVAFFEQQASTLQQHRYAFDMIRNLVAQHYSF